MRVSLLIRNRNYGRFLRRALESALAQDHPRGALEVVVVDDGSTDESPRILQEYAHRVRVLAGPGRGAVAALNLAVRESTGEAFTLLDADDWAEPGLASTLAGTLAANTAAGFAYCDYYEETVDGADRRLVSLARDPFQGVAGGILYRRDLVSTLGGYDETMLFAEYDLLAKALRRRAGLHVARPLYHYVRHGANLTADPERVWREIEKLRDRHGPSLRIRSYAGPPAPVVLRPARGDEPDGRLLFDWRNDPSAIATTFSQAAVDWETHRAWYAARVAEATCRLFIAEESGVPVGMIRFENRGEAWEVSVAVDAARRGAGLGTRILRLGERTLRDAVGNVRIVARIREDNPASQAAFEKAGYRMADRIVVNGVAAQVWEKPPLP